MLKHRVLRLVVLMLAATGLMALAGCDSSNNTPAVVTPSIAPTFQVTDTAGNAVEGATVYAVPAADVAEISAVPLTLTTGNYDAAALNADEPLEDLVNDNFAATIGVANYTTATTDATGTAVLTGLSVSATDMFFIYVAPAGTDAAHLPGGSLCRTAVSGASLDNKVTTVEVSTTPSAAATYIGSSACLNCHNGTVTADKSGVKMTAHKHGIMAIGSPSGLQDLSKFDADDGIYNYMAGVDKFTAGDATDITTGTTVYFSDYDGNRGFDKFKTSMTDPTASGGIVYATVRLYKDTTTQKYMMQITNILNSSDPKMTIEVAMTYGGGVYKQRYTAKNAAGTSLNILPLQYQTAGDDTSADRTRKQYRDYHMDRWYAVTTDPTTGVVTDGALNAEPTASHSFDINCASCHYTGYQVTDLGTGEYTATAVDDPNGTVNPLTGTAQEMNVGCETCHGPGSEHALASGNGVAIVTPNNLSPSRETQICGQCHARAQGKDAFAGSNDQTVDVNGKMIRPGTSRADYLANNTSRDDATTKNFWADGLHSKSHHQQFTDFIQSKMYRNDSELETCTSCHEVHGPGTDRHQLTGTSDNSLCASCHATQGADIVAHMTSKTGTNMNAIGGNTLCIDCHFAKNAKSGAGDPIGKTIAGVTYYHNDISSHLLTVATKADAAAQKMPVPYTNTCGGCHDLGTIPAP